MTASYPDSIKSFDTKVALVDVVRAEHINSLQDEVTAMQEVMGSMSSTDDDTPDLLKNLQKLDFIGIGSVEYNTPFLGYSSRLRAITAGDMASYFQYEGNGWIQAGGWDAKVGGASRVWSYSSAGVIKCSNSSTSEFPTGIKIKFNQAASTKYFYGIGASATTDGGTLVTITGGSDYALTTDDISATYYSYYSAADGFPECFNYTPVWTASGTNPVLNDGTLTGKFIINGRVVKFNIAFAAGASTTYGTGSWRFSLPATAAADNPISSGMAEIFDAGSGFARYHRIAVIDTGASTTYIQAIQGVMDGNTSFALTSTVPITWASGDLLRIGWLDYLI